MPPDYSQIPDNQLEAYMLFAEADKTDMAAFEQDATGIAHVIQNRKSRPERFGESTQKVLFKPKQFSAVGGEEWNKVANGKLTEKEEEFYKKALQIVNGVRQGLIEDPTGGADHYYNPELANPDWGTIYPETFRSGGHKFVSEVKHLARKNVSEEVLLYQKRLSDIGYDLGKVDGINGKKTKSVVKQFQKDNGLKVDGIVGKQTLSAMFAE